MPHALRVVAVVLACSLLPAWAAAQAGGGVVTGTVADRAGRPLPDADVILTPGGARARTDERGRFTFRNVAAGTHQLHVRLIGYRPAEAEVRMTRGARIARDVTLDRTPQALDTVRVVDQDGCAPTSIDGFECRRGAGIGMFRDAGELRALRPEHWADMFDGMPGIRRESRNGPYGREWRVTVPPSRCLVELWNGQPRMDLGSEAPFQPDEFWRPIDVIAIEFYDDYHKVPARYRGFAWPPFSQQCALVIYWLRGATRDAPPPPR